MRVVHAGGILAAVLGCAGCGDNTGADGSDGAVDARIFDGGPPTGGGPYPAPGAWGANAGPGGPKRTFAPGELFTNCAFLDGGEADPDDHHNLAQMYDGYLVLPFAPEYGLSGGLAFFDISEPCAPVRVGVGAAAHMRETHSIGFASHGGRWAVTNSLTWEPVYGGGIEFWDVRNPTAPVEAAVLDLPGFLYPDSYARLTLSVFWQAPYVYVAGADNGIYIVDATFPDAPVLVGTYPIQPTLRVGQLQVMGNILIATSAEGARALLLDVSDPAHPQPIPGGDFMARDAGGVVREAYFTTAANGKLYFARKDGGGGVIIYDIVDPTRPTYVGSFASDGNGGYVFVKDQYAFVGEGAVARIYDLTDPANITIHAETHLTGDLDTITPIGNVVVLSVDDEADPDHGSAIAPWQLAPDTQAPRVTWTFPAAGATAVPRTSRIGVGLGELVDVRSAFAGSVRLYPTGTDPAATRINGFFSAQETLVNFWPFAPLAPSTEYTLELPAGGLADLDGNALAETFTLTFTTGP
jgi:hypothetical protein